jgi:phosphatidylserine/phosphatidylglycerophosphate/cardiolipin synthase-like enzyme
VKKLLVSVLVAATAAVTVQVAPSSLNPGATASVASVAQARDDVAREGGRDKGKRKPPVKPYYVKPGVVFNDPYTDPFAWRRQLIPAIRRTHSGEMIRVMTWSFFDSHITDTLIEAYKRGVVIRLIMSRALSQQGEAGHNYRRLASAFRQPARPHFKRPKSWVRTCSNSCRGRGGVMHFKWVSFTRTGRSQAVVMQGSANLNIRASVDQWNDWLTTVGRKKVFRTYSEIFRQAVKDRPFPPVTLTQPGSELWFAPRHDDKIMQLLNAITCRGAGSLGIGGRTVVRVGAAVISSPRGERIAKKLNQLDRAGCDIRVVYTLAPKGVKANWPGVATRQLARDYNGDGLYDDYLHMKAMSVQGYVYGDRNNSFVYQGSANWSGVGQISDDQGMVLRDRKLAGQYRRWIERLYSKGTYPSAVSARRVVGPDGKPVDPYANIRAELR